MSAGNGTRVVHSPVPRLELSPRSPSLQVGPGAWVQRRRGPALGRRWLGSSAQEEAGMKEAWLVASKHQGCCLDNVSTTGTADLPCPDHCKELLRIVITSFLEGSIK
uniref:Uncharacterized protein n=1 Tax=Oryza nivara TaxID=4536 RepID=A0A0E0HSV1_ORYNI